MFTVGLFGKKKRRKKTCCCSAVTPDMVNGGGDCRVKVLGAGCKSCHEMYENAMEAASGHGLCEEVAYITDMPKVACYGVMKLPALVIDEKVISQGKILKADEIEKLMKEAGL